MSAHPPISPNLAIAPISRFMKRQVVYALSSTSIRIAMKTMIQHKVSGLPVVDDAGRCVGVYSELDAMIQGASVPLDKPIKYTKPAFSVLGDDIFKDVLVLLVKKRIKRVPVLDADRRLIGVVSRGDLMKAILDDLDAHEAK